MSKYIIKNCPNLYELFDGLICTATDNEDYCQNCTDCVLKQIVELCREENYAWLAKEILQKLDIQEVE